jgi:hypothetical protein
MDRCWVSEALVLYETSWGGSTLVGRWMYTRSGCVWRGVYLCYFGTGTEVRISVARLRLRARKTTADLKSPPVRPADLLPRRQWERGGVGPDVQ